MKCLCDGVTVVSQDGLWVLRNEAPAVLAAPISWMTESCGTSLHDEFPHLAVASRSHLPLLAALAVFSWREGRVSAGG